MEQGPEVLALGYSRVPRSERPRNEKSECLESARFFYSSILGNVRFRFGPFEADEERFELRRQGALVPAQRHVLELLFFLIRNRGRVVSKAELVQGPWHGSVVGDDALKRAAMLARRALSNDGAHFIATVRGKGFRFDAEVTTLEGKRVALTPSARGGSLFVGRARELADLSERLERTRGGAGGLVLVHGAPGIGKSELLEQFARAAQATGATVAFCSCHEALAAPAFWPWLELLRSLSRSELGLSGEIERGGVARLLALFEAGAGSGEPQSPTADRQARFRAFDGLVRLLSQACEAQPLVLVIDDLHEADASSLCLLEYLSRRIASERLLVVSALPRLGDVEQAVPALFRASSSVLSTLELEGLGSAEVAALLEASPNPSAAGLLADSVQRATNGHPLLIQELLRSSASSNLPQTGSRVLAAPKMPERLAAFLRARLSPLPEATRAALRVAAVLGREFSWPLVQRALPLQPDCGLAPLEPALLIGLVEASGVGAGSYRFVHGLERDIIYQDLGPAVRAELHEKAALCLESSPGASNLNALARQFAAACTATGAHVEKAKRYGLMAAAHARRLYAHEVALEHYASTLSLLDPEACSQAAERARILLQIAEISLVLGEAASALRALERALSAARASEDVGSLAEVVLGYAALECELGEPQPKLGALLREALAKVPSQTGVQARLLAADSARRSFEHSGRAQLASSARALALAREVGEASTVLAVLRIVHPQLLGPAHVREASRRADEMKRLAEQGGDSLALMDARLWQARHLLELGRAHEFAFEAAEHADLARATRHPRQQWFERVLSATRAYQSGQIDQARATLRRGLALEGLAQPPLIRAMFGVHLLNVALELCGQERRRALEEVRAIVDGLCEQNLELSSFRFLRPLLRLQLGDSSGARQLFQASAEEVLALPEDGELLPSLVSMIDLFTAFKDQRGLRAASERLWPYAGLHVCAALSDWGPVSFHLGRAAQALDEDASSRASFEQALLDTEGAGSRPWLSWTRYRYARTLAQSPHRADRTEAASLVALAHSDANRYHLAALAEATRSSKVPSPRVLLALEPQAGGAQSPGMTEAPALLKRSPDS
jgi:DNA-binding winged helix-turn-helix (wHTH) protein/tetratricopeptide (TPR) repeat protein